MSFLKIFVAICNRSVSTELGILYACIATFILNIPFGYFRGGFKKLSVCWFVIIHAAVPPVIYIRKLFGLSLTWPLAPFLLGSFFLGQYFGRKIWEIHPIWKKQFECSLKKLFKKNH